MKPPQALDYRLIRDQINDLLVACPRRVEREWPPKYYGNHNARTIVHCSTKIVINTFRTIQFLCVENPKDWRHRPEFAASVLPLVRTILESIFTLTFLFEDVPRRSSWFMKAGWRELWEETQRQQQRYGSNPIWTNYLRERAERMELAKKLWGVSAEDAANPESIPRWPIPSRMKPKDPKIADFLTYLNDWFYRELSSVAHGDLPGMIFQSKILLSQDTILIPDDPEMAEADLKFLRSYGMGLALVLLLAFLSEVQIGLDFDPPLGLAYPWGILNAYAPFAEELYRERYRQHFSSQSS